MSRHDWRNYKTCLCGEPGCGSYRAFPDGPTSRELRAPSGLDAFHPDTTHNPDGAK